MRNLTLYWATVALFAMTSGWLTAQMAPAHPTLPNLDLRRTAAARAALPSTNSASVISAAEDALRLRVPGLQISRDRVLGSPRHIAAARGFLSGPGGAGLAVNPATVQMFSAQDPHRAIKAFIADHQSLYGFDATALSTARVVRDFVTSHDGLRTVVWQQTLQNIEVFDGLLVGHVTRNGELVSISSFFLPDPAAVADSGHPASRLALVALPPVTPVQAVMLAAANLGATLDPGSITHVGAPEGADRVQSLSAPGLRGNAELRLVWLPWNRSAMRLAWWVVLASRIRPEMYSLVLDAETGEVVIRRCLTSYATSHSYRVYSSDSPSPFTPGLQSPGTRQPDTVQRALLSLESLDFTASPNGWISTGTETRGNNVDAHLDRNDDDQPDLPRPKGADNTFDFTLDLSQSPLNYGDASVVNLFYWNNFMHDRLYELGFTEAAGNFQNTNFNRGGRGNDAVQADSQDGANLDDLQHQDNSNFSVPPDGIPGRMQMYLFRGSDPARDGSLDAEVICHEYVHGLSGRLLGAGVGIFELQASAMGEGWSDFYALSLLSEPADDPHACYPFAGYVSQRIAGNNFQQNYYFGIRRYPYSTDPQKNPLTLKDIDPSQASPHSGVPVSPVFGGTRADEVHAMGEVWCVALWEARANLMDKLGPVAGNQLMLQLVTDGLKLAPANATFLEARDSILKADEIQTGGENRRELWIAFARRGMGAGAVVPASDSPSGTEGVIESFDLPNDIALEPEDGILELAVTPRNGSLLIGGVNNPLFIRVTDGAANITNATIAIAVSGGTNAPVRNDGKAPDVSAGNSVYSTYLVPSLGSTSVVVTLVVSAPGKQMLTNTVNYAAAPPPPNDSLTNALKVPLLGSNYILNNQFATIESSEPRHAGIGSVAASLWWSYSSPSNSVLLIDTAGSDFNTVIAVYTNQTLGTLKPVAAVDDVGTRQQAFLQFSVQAGVTYRIAIAGYDKGAIGTLAANFQPNGTPDTNAPFVTVVSPSSGVTVTSNRLTLTGTAVDPDPNPSGVRNVQLRVNAGLATAPGDSSVSGAITLSLNSLLSTNWTQTVTLSEGVNDIEVTAVDFAGNVSARQIIQVTYLVQDPPNDFFVLAAELDATSGVVTGNNTKATREVGEPLHANVGGGRSIWWHFQAPADGILTLSTTNSSFDTLLALYTGDLVNALTPIASSDDAYPGAPGGFSQIAQAVRAGQTYGIAVDGYDGASGAVFLHYSFATGRVFRVTVANSSGGIITPGSGDYLSNAVATFTAQPGAFSDFLGWQIGTAPAYQNPVSVTVNSDLTLSASFFTSGPSDSFESGRLTGSLPWATSGDLPWIVQTNSALAGSFAARSGAIGDDQTSSLKLNASFRGGAASFAYRVSSEAIWDSLSFYVDGVLQQNWSGDTGWQVWNFALGGGPHALEFRYVKDSNGASGLDAAFLDDLRLPLSLPTDSTSPARLSVIQTYGGVTTIQVMGQTNQQYVIESSTNLSNWLPLTTNVAVGGVIHVVDPAFGTRPTTFYRGVVR